MCLLSIISSNSLFTYFTVTFLFLSYITHVSKNKYLSFFHSTSISLSLCKFVSLSPTCLSCHGLFMAVSMQYSSLRVSSFVIPSFICFDFELALTIECVPSWKKPNNVDERARANKATSKARQGKGITFDELSKCKMSLSFWPKN